MIDWKCPQCSRVLKYYNLPYLSCQYQHCWIAHNPNKEIVRYYAEYNEYSILSYKDDLHHMHDNKTVISKKNNFTHQIIFKLFFPIASQDDFNSIINKLLKLKAFS